MRRDSATQRPRGAPEPFFVPRDSAADEQKEPKRPSFEELFLGPLFSGFEVS